MNYLNNNAGVTYRNSVTLRGGAGVAIYMINNYINKSKSIRREIFFNFIKK
jgi:hypothetical protein